MLPVALTGAISNMVVELMPLLPRMVTVTGASSLLLANGNQISGGISHEVLLV
jgi:hypothetical protein